MVPLVVVAVDRQLSLEPLVEAHQASPIHFAVLGLIAHFAVEATVHPLVDLSYGMQVVVELVGLGFAVAGFVVAPQESAVLRQGRSLPCVAVIESVAAAVVADVVEFAAAAAVFAVAVIEFAVAAVAVVVAAVGWNYLFASLVLLGLPKVVGQGLGLDLVLVHNLFA